MTQDRIANVNNGRIQTITTRESKMSNVNNGTVQRITDTVTSSPYELASCITDTVTGYNSRLEGGLMNVNAEVKCTGKPCAGKPHARFDEGTEETWTMAPSGPLTRFRSTLPGLWTAVLLAACLSMLAGLASADFQPQVEAAQALGKIQSADAKERGTAVNDLMGLVALHHKSLLQKPQVYSAVADQLRKETDPGVRTQLINLAASLKVQEAYPTLLQIAQHAKEIGSRRHALWAIAQVKGAGAIPDLKMAFEYDPSTGVKFEAAKQLGELGDASGFDWALQQMKGDMSEWGSSRGLATEILGAIGRVEAIPALKLLADSQAPGAGGAKEAILEIQFKSLTSAKEKFDFLTKILHDSDPGACWAVGKLSAMRTPAALQILLDVARVPTVPGKPGYSAHECAKEAIENMYWDNTQAAGRKIQEMEQTGVLQPLPEQQ